MKITSLLKCIESGLDSKIAKGLFLAAGLFFLFQTYVAVAPFIRGTVVITNDYVNIPEQTKINGQYYDNTDFIKNYLQAKPQRNFYRGDVFDLFLTNNNYEMAWSTQAGWFMHHHNYLLSPVSQFAAGKNLKEITQQYGVLTTVILTYLMKMCGGITFDNYLKVLYSFYPLYYLLFFLLVFFLLRDARYVFLTMLAAAACVYALSYVSIYLAPGFNPIRQLFILCLVGALFLYFRKKRGYFLGAIGLFSILTILSNQEFGIFAAAAVFTTIIFRNFWERKKMPTSEIVFCWITIPVVLYLMFGVHFGNNELGGYYFHGISGPLVDKVLLKVIFLTINLVYLLFAGTILKAKDDLKYIAVLLFLYIQGLLVYYIWNSAPNHFFSIVTPFILFAGVVLRLCFDKIIKGYRGLATLGLAGLIFIFFYTPALHGYKKEKEIFDNIAQTHKVYKWFLPRAKIYTTMDPKPFVNGIGLIDKYAAGSDSIYIISSYDNFITFLAGKSSAMPFPEVGISLLTEKETRMCIDKILKDMPEYLFVDTGVDNGIYDRDSNKMLTFACTYFDFTSKMEMWQELKKVYFGVKKYYRLVEQGDIISVYKKIGQ